ncbi:unnamed protein product, partial [Ascophyllum nodosum]
MSLLRVESVKGPFHECGDGGTPDCWPVVERQIAEAFGRKKSKCAQRTTSCGRGFASQMWERSYRLFMLCAGRPASLFLDKNPLDIVQKGTTRAFMPYYRTKDE